MYVLDQIKHLRQSILDDTGGTGVVWEDITESDAEASQLRWTNEELAFFLTQAEREVARRAMLLKDVSGNYDITTVADQANYTLDPKVLRVIHAEIDGVKLEDIEIEEIYSRYKWQDTVRKPTHIISDYGSRTVSLWAKPDDVYTVQLIVYRLPLADLSFDTADFQEPEIDEKHHFPMLNYAAYLAYLKDEANALDPNRAAIFKSLFDMEYPERSWASEVRKMRNRGRTVRYGGL